MTDTVTFYGECIPFRLCESPERAIHALQHNPTSASGYTHYYQERPYKTDKDGVSYYPLYRYGDGIREIRILHGVPVETPWRIVCDDGRSDLHLPLEVLSTLHYEFYLAIPGFLQDQKLSYAVQYVQLPYSQRIKYANMMNPLSLPSLSKEKEIIPQ